MGEATLRAERLTRPAVPPQLLPRHVGIQPDGNGRWASLRGLPRSEGHAAGAKPVLDVIGGAVDIGIPYLSLHTFTTENWRRPAAEVDLLIRYLGEFLRDHRDQLNDMGVRVRWMGQQARMPTGLLDELTAAEELTKHNRTLRLQFLLNYGGRAEIADAARSLAREAAAGRLDPESIDERLFGRFLQEPDLPDVDLFLRTSGEQRLSNFSLWRSAYAEMVFIGKLWPDVDRRDLWRALEVYAGRDRRHGGLAGRTLDLTDSPVP